MTRFVKQEVAIRYWLQGSKFYNALEAMEFAKSYHKGFRKDGVTPEFSHQIAIANYIRTIVSGLQYPEETMSTIFLHDVREDYHVSHEEIDSRFGSLVANAVDAMTKEFRGVKKPENLVFEQIAASPIASVAKGGDRVHNFSTMVGVFSKQKQVEYLGEGEELFLPMLKKARRMHVRQEPCYENIKSMLISQMTLIKEIHKAGCD